MVKLMIILLKKIKINNNHDNINVNNKDDNSNTDYNDKKYNNFNNNNNFDNDDNDGANKVSFNSALKTRLQMLETMLPYVFLLCKLQ